VSDIRAIPASEFPTLPSSGIVIDIHPEGKRCVVHVAGELDRASSGKLIVTSTAGTHAAMVIDLDAVTFMDCSGYGAIVESRRVLEAGGRTLTVRGQSGQPARLLELIAVRDKIEADQAFA
jgi:anti-anti-sigma factor